MENFHASLGARFKRRVISIPLYALVFSLLWNLAPILFLATIAADLISKARKLPRTRCLFFVLAYFAFDLAAIVGCFCTWAFYGAWPFANKPRFVAADAWIQRVWCASAFNLAKRLFQVTVIVDGEDVAATGPFLLFLRHTSLTDVLLGAAFIAVPRKIVLRYTLKEALLWDPGIDIVTHRLPNAFLKRGSGSANDKDIDIRAIKDLAAHLGPKDAVLMYPEGTRFTSQKREKALQRLRQSASTTPIILDMAERMHHVLPPRPGGPLALLAAAPKADVVFCAHTGLEHSNSFKHVWRGGLMDITLRVHFWRVPAAHIPKEPSEQLLWLYREWLKVEEWIDHPK